jgi:hypothetical protein
MTSDGHTHIDRTEEPTGVPLTGVNGRSTL